ncbi:MAG TPA: hypothetical protein VJM82_03385 [Nitrospiraceae bacterium]|nr:hypothetical protein [Nitrospiraceae bacterium]
MGNGRPKNPVIAGVLSGIIPGMGQFYCRQWGKGTGFLVGAIAADAAFGVSAEFLKLLQSFGSDVRVENLGSFLVGSLLFLAIAIWSVVDAVRTAKRSYQ